MPIPVKLAELANIERPATVKDRVCQALETAILGGVFGEDIILTEGALAEKFDVSRTPVREALQELDRKGLLEPAGRRGKRVRHLRREEIRELYWLRLVLEGAVAERLARVGLSEEQITEVRRYFEDQKVAMDAEDRVAFLAADSSFHIALAKSLGFPKVTAIIVNLRQLLHLTGLKAVKRVSRLEEVIHEHTKIVDAILQRDANAACQSMTDHLTRTEQLVLAEIEPGVNSE